MKKIMLVLAFLVCASCGYAEDAPLIDPRVLQADVKDIVQLTADVKEGAPVKWVNVYDRTHVTLMAFPKSPDMVIFQGKTAGVYRIGYYTLTGAALSEVTWFTITVGGSIPVPPGPNPPGPQPPGPTPPIDPATVRLPFHILVLEETAEATVARGQLLSNVALINRVKAKGHAFAVVDKDLASSDPNLKPWLARTAKLPWMFIVDANAKILYSGDVPAAQGIMDWLDKLGG